MKRINFICAEAQEPSTVFSRTRTGDLMIIDVDVQRACASLACPSFSGVRRLLLGWLQDVSGKPVEKHRGIEITAAVVDRSADEIEHMISDFEAAGLISVSTLGNVEP